MTTPWIYNGTELTEIPEGAYGFVYRITNTITGRKYIGKKKFINIRRTRKTGAKRRQTKRIEQWRNYTGSNKVLNEDIEKLGKDKFYFEILAIAESQGQLSYLEENIQHKLDVIMREDYYNDNIGPGRYRNVKKLEPIRLDI